MKTILLWDPRFPDRRPRRLTVADDIASAAVRSGVAAAANPSDAGALASGPVLDGGALTDVVLQHGSGTATARVALPLSVALVGAAMGLIAGVRAVISGISPIPAKALTFSNGEPLQFLDGSYLEFSA